MELGDLEARDFIGLLRVEFEQAEQTAFAEDDEFAVGHDAGAAAVDVGCGCAVGLPVFVAVPHEFAGFEFDAAKMGVGLVATAEGVKDAVVVNRRVPMEFEGCGAPEFLNVEPLTPTFLMNGG